MTSAPGVGTKGSSVGFAVSISLNPRSNWRAISMSDSPGSTTRWQIAPMTSISLHVPGESHSATWMIGQGGGAGGAGGGSATFASGTGGTWAQPTPRAARRSRAPGRKRRVTGMAEGLVEGRGRDKGLFRG